MDIAIYGGSFNPPHLGHREAVITALKKLNTDRLMIIPDYEPPHKEMEADSPTPEQRMELCRLTFGDLKGIEISDMELKRSGKSYTFDTVRDLQQLYPGSRLTLVIGTDMLLSFEEWYRYEYLLEHCRIAALTRDHAEEESLRETADRFRREYHANIVLLDHVPMPMSSTELRKKLQLREGAEMIRAEAYAEIIRCRFYEAKPELSWLRKDAYTMLDKKRIPHVAGCESEAVKLAGRWGEDPETAAEAGILHDITKRLSGKEQLNLCKKYAIICDSALRAMPSLLHAKTGAAAARERYGVSDEVYNAICWHTTGKPDMTTLEKIIYLADYIEPTRDFPGVEKIRALAYEDLDRALLLGLQMTVEEVRARGEEPYVDTLDACNWYEKRIAERRNANAEP